MGRKKVEINPICGKRLQQIITERGLTHEEYKDILHCTTKHISNMVTGKASITEQTARIAVNDYNMSLKNEQDHITVAWLLGFDDYKNKKEWEGKVYKRDANSKSIIEDLIDSHGYRIIETQQAEIQITSPFGVSKTITPKEYMSLLNRINDIVEGMLLLEFKPDTDIAKSYWRRKG